MYYILFSVGQITIFDQQNLRDTQYPPLEFSTYLFKLACFETYLWVAKKESHNHQLHVVNSCALA
jgi:hypothetical protein